MNAAGGSSSGSAATSLRARALKLLAAREHSCAELSRKLAPHAESQEQLAGLLEELARTGYLSEQRFVESLVRRRGAGRGSRRVEQELKQHHVPEEIAAPLLRQLAAGDRDRALQAWRKRFGRPPADLAERARQQRFLLQRGFDADTIADLFRSLRAQGLDTD